MRYLRVLFVVVFLAWFALDLATPDIPGAFRFDFDVAETVEAARPEMAVIDDFIPAPRYDDLHQPVVAESRLVGPSLAALPHVDRRGDRPALSHDPSGPGEDH